MSKNQAKFSPIRSYLWPIHGNELRKILPLVALAFFIGFNYSILRNMKDALLITAESSGAEVIPFIKVWGIVPGAFLMTYIYSRLNNRLKRDRVFYAMVAIFLTFFTLFTFVIYPIRDLLHPHQTADWLQGHLPPGFKGLIAMFRYWTFSIFYIMSELWSSAILSMLFWGFANEVTRVTEAKRFYGIIAVGLNMSSIVAGQVSVFLTGNWLRFSFQLPVDAWHQSIILLTTVVLSSGLVIVSIYRYLTKKVLTRSIYQENVASQKKAKIKMSMRENFSYLAKSKYLICIAIIVLSYNICINLVEVIWKDQVNMLYPNPNQYNAYMSQITTFTGIISFFTSIFISGQMIRKFGWSATSLTTPIIFLVTSIGFFIFFFGHSTFMGILSQLGTSPLVLVVLFGSLQNCFARAAKFTLFDATKEIAFVPLSREGKLKGKAAIDGFGSRLGKSGGAIIHQLLLVIFVTISASAHIVAAILALVIGVWMVAALALGKQFNTLVATEPTASAPSEAPAPSEEVAASPN